MRFLVLISLVSMVGPQHIWSQTSPNRWSLAPSPLVSIGANGEDTLILGATSGTRLSNGDIVVASSKNARLLWFNSKGHFLRAAGRRGRGPGEFGSDIHLTRVASDTVVVYDANNRRYTHLDPTGAVTSIEQKGDIRHKAWLYSRNLLEHLPASVPFGQLQTTLARIPFAKADTLRLGRVTADGLIWLRNNPSSPHYTIYTQTGALAGSIDLPDRFDPWEITATTVLGRWLDQDDVEHIELRTLISPNRVAGTKLQTAGIQPYDQDAELTRQGSLVGTMRAVLRNVLTANEAFYSSNRRYAKSVSELGAPEAIVSTGVKVTFVWADAQSYAALASHASTPITCVIVLSPNPSVTGSLLCG